MSVPNPNLAEPSNCCYNRSMPTTHRNKLNRLYTRLTPGMPLTSEDLAAQFAAVNVKDPIRTARLTAGSSIAG
jgi:hypothetical protein